MLKQLRADETEWLLHDWALWARDDQLAPAGDWTSYVMAALGLGALRNGVAKVE